MLGLSKIPFGRKEYEKNIEIVIFNFYKKYQLNI